MINIDLERGAVTVYGDGTEVTHPLSSPDAFAVLSQAWLRAGWDTKYVYSFTWMGRPIIQLPEDLLRIQEVIYALQPDVVVETGIAHGGSLIFYASLFRSMGKGRCIGVDIEIRPHNRRAIEEHELSDLITMYEGSSTDAETIAKVTEDINEAGSVMVLLDSCHTYDHVLAELRAYSPLVTKGSYIVAMDGIMKEMVGAPRTDPDWDTNNPMTAIEEFVAEEPDFIIEEPEFAFNEGAVTGRVTYWPNAYLKRVN